MEVINTLFIIDPRTIYTTFHKLFIFSQILFFFLLTNAVSTTNVLFLSDELSITSVGTAKSLVKLNPSVVFHVPTL